MTNGFIQAVGEEVEKGELEIPIAQPFALYPRSRANKNAPFVRMTCYCVD